MGIGFFHVSMPQTSIKSNELEIYIRKLNDNAFSIIKLLEVSILRINSHPSMVCVDSSYNYYE
ncbi:CLUMA_CG001307, isoform A [Clunio marinus]|uniref:CLUMA_CG001307, isoform A n=1 Tax=Clunio marinus TaxID=568069 RepID=A0A1J1HIX2_9DIPT|nr:CLUMA_CG001307, isoform A [Clunio marinus]